MMREILFRGKRVDNGEWVYGWYAPLVCNDRTVIPSIKDSNGSDWRVEPGTVGQFTGLCDKNGNKIFEGDILLKGFENVLVKWNANQCRWGIYSNNYEICGFNESTQGYFEVIGNKWDNSELIGEEQ